MIRTAALMVSLNLACVGVGAMAGELGNHAPSGKRLVAAQVNGCMKRRMAADLKISYNEALRRCKDLVRQQSEGLDSGALVAKDSSPKR